MKKLIYFTALVAGLVVPVKTFAIMETYEFNSGFQNSGNLPDGNPSGLADLRNISSSITSITDVKVSLNLSGTWNGDIYATLQHDSGFSVLLNRVGRNGGNSFGFGDDGFDVLLDDSGAFPDVHTQTSGGGTLNGTYSADGRNVDPNSVVTGDARTAGLSSFNGLNASGDWTLFLADLSTGDQFTLESWGLKITGDDGGGQRVPDGGVTAVMLSLALLCVARSRRQM